MAERYPTYVSQNTYNREALEYIASLVLGGASPANPSADAFGRSRVGLPFTVFGSKLIDSDKPFFWDDQQVSGSGTTSVHSANRSGTRIGVSNLTAGKRVRQTFQRFNYQPGMSQFILTTGIDGTGVAGITRRRGYFDDKNGPFFQLAGTTLGVGIRSYVTGVAVDTVVTQANWNIDPMDGTGPSGITLNTAASNIYAIDVEWLGVGDVRFGVVINNFLYYIHVMKHANTLDSVYMTTPNLPIRYEIENDGTGPAATLEQICSAVISEGGQTENGQPTYLSTGATPLSTTAAAGTIYAAIGFRLKSTHLASVVRQKKITVISTGNDDFEWLLILKPTVAGVFTYGDQANSAIQVAIGATANTVTGGTIIDGGFALDGESAVDVLESLRYIGSTIAAVPEELVLCIRPLSTTASFHVSLSLIETS